jgi:hypothetical protein
MAVVAGWASHDRPDAPVSKWTTEARELERKDVREEVEQRFRSGDLRFKGWVKRAADTAVILPGVSEDEAASLREVSLAVGEVLYVEDLIPFFVENMQQWEQRTTALFDYMQRFNRTLLEKVGARWRRPKKGQQGARANAGICHAACDLKPIEMNHNVKDEPRPWLARRVRHDDLDSRVSIRDSFGSTRRDSHGRWLWRLVGRFKLPPFVGPDDGERSCA